MYIEKLIDGYYIKLNGRVVNGPFGHEHDAHMQFIIADYYANRDAWLENSPFNKLVNEITDKICNELEGQVEHESDN